MIPHISLSTIPENNGSVHVLSIFLNRNGTLKMQNQVGDRLFKEPTMFENIANKGFQ
jgi:hypothetical protein